jgi:cytochrome c
MIRIAVTAALTLLATSALAQGSATAGAQIFASQCAMCHATSAGTPGIGPSLAGVYGNRAAATPGYSFSPALIAAKLTWNDATLDKFLAGPQAEVPGTKMPYAGLPDAGQRADLIAFLATLKGS